MHFFVVFTLPMIEFGHAQISVPKIGILMSKTACIKPWKYFSIFSPNVEKYVPEKLQIRTLFRQWHYHEILKELNTFVEGFCVH